MEKMKELNRYQKGILILLAAMAIVFGVLYSRVASKTGFLYMDKIFEASQENGNTVYSGKIHGEECKFTVNAEREVTFQYGEKTMALMK